MRGKIIASVLVVLLSFIVKTLFDAGELKSLRVLSETKLNAKCKLIKAPGAVGLEDGTLDMEIDTGIAYFSSDNRTAWFTQSMPLHLVPNGGVFSFDFQTEQLTAMTLEDFPFPFHPHGISLAKGAEGKQLFVINHRPTGEFVEVFKVDSAQNTLKYQYSVQHPLFVSPNDLLALGDREFIVSNDHATTKGTFMHAVEEFTQRPWAKLVYCSSSSPSQSFNCKVVSRGIAYSNGINISPDRKTIYVATCIEQRILTFAYNEKTQTLTEGASVYLNTAPDNIEIDENGFLYVGAHPKLLTFLLHSKNPIKNLSPTQVLKINPKNLKYEELLLTNGNLLSASSVAVPFRGKFAVGAVFSEGLLLCQE